jgi:hypothetical protein
MGEKIRQHIRSNVVGYVALFIALSGTAYAAGTVGSADIIDESILSQDIKNGEVKTLDIAPNAIGTGRLADGAVQNQDLAADSVTTDKVKDETLKALDIAPESLGSGRIKDGTLTGADILNGSLTSVETDPLISTSGPDSIPANKFSVRPIELTTPADTLRNLTPWNGMDGLWLQVQCHVFGSTSLTLIGSDTTGSTLNWFYSDGSAVFANGVALEAGDFGQFGFDSKRIEGQFIYADPNGKITVNVHAVDLTGSCEVHGTAVRAAD